VATDRQMKILEFRNQLKNMGHVTSMKMRKDKKKTNETETVNVTLLRILKDSPRTSSENYTQNATNKNLFRK
jgi:hypothetical protein